MRDSLVGNWKKEKSFSMYIKLQLIIIIIITNVTLLCHVKMTEKRRKSKTNKKILLTFYIFYCLSPFSDKCIGHKIVHVICGKKKFLMRKCPSSLDIFINPLFSFIKDVLLNRDFIDSSGWGFYAIYNLNFPHLYSLTFFFLNSIKLIYQRKLMSHIY